MDPKKKETTPKPKPTEIKAAEQRAANAPIYRHCFL